MDYIYGLIEGLLKGLGEFLPLSSSGHRLILKNWITLPAQGSLALFAEIGALLAALLLCRKTLAGIIKGIGDAAEKAKKGRFRRKKAPKELMLLGFLLLASLPPAAAAVIKHFHDFTASISASLLWAGIGFLLNGGLLFIGSHSLCRKWEVMEMKGGHALKLGLFRAVAGMVPGLSPFGATAAMAMNMGFEPTFAAEFSILMAIPSLLGSILWKIGSVGSIFWGPALISLISAAFAGALAIFLVRILVKKEKFGLFMFYSLAAGVAAFVLNAI